MLVLKRNDRLSGVLSLACSIVAAASGGSSHRADAGSVRVLGEIIVTARKKEFPQDALVLINAFSKQQTANSKQQIKQQRIDSLGELAQFTPGLQTSETTASVGGSVFLRGRHGQRS